MNNNKINNVMTENGMDIRMAIPATRNYHMNWDAIKAFQPEKAQILEEYWGLIGQHPQKNSTPIYDCTDGIIYPTITADCYSQDVATRTAILKAINNRDTVFRYYGESKTNWHYIVAVEDVPISIIKACVAKLRGQKIEESRDKARIKELEAQLDKIKKVLGY